MHEIIQVRRHLFSIFNQNWKLSKQFSGTPVWNFMEIRCTPISVVVLESLHAYGQTDGRTDRQTDRQTDRRIWGAARRIFAKNKGCCRKGKISSDN